MTLQTIPNMPELTARADPWPMLAGELRVTTQAGLDRARDLLQDIKALRDEIARSCDPVIKAALDAHRAAVRQKKELDEPLANAETTIKGKAGAFLAEQRRIRAEAEAKAAAEARRAQEEAEATAAQLEKTGEHELAEMVRDEAREAAVTPPPPPVPTSKGISSREIWKARVTDKAALVRAVAAGTVPLAVVKIDQTVLNGQARTLKRELAWPGVEVYSEMSTSTRKR